LTVEKVFERFSGYLSNELMMRTLLAIVAICLGYFLIAGLLRLITGKRGTAVGSVSVTLDALILFLLATLLPLYAPAVASYLPPLPFVSIDSGILTLIPIPELSREILCLQLIHLFLIAFLFGLADVLLPEGRNIVIWILLRAVTILLIFTCIWFLNKLNESLVPDYIQTYAPIILLILIALFFSVCDIICILFFCPFQSWIMKNRCCTTCRIYNWDFAMMFTPLIFLPSLYTYSLLGCALLLLLRWELTYYRHPERFFGKTNACLDCARCEEKLCQHKKQLQSFLKKRAAKRAARAQMK
jgi:hypothetical protein